MVVEILLIAGAFVGAWFLARTYPRETRLWFDRIVAARRVFFFLIGLAFALVFLGTGSPILMLFGFLGFLYGGLYLLFEKPHQEVLSWIGK